MLGGTMDWQARAAYMQAMTTVIDQSEKDRRAALRHPEKAHRPPMSQVGPWSPSYASDESDPSGEGGPAKTAGGASGPSEPGAAEEPGHDPNKPS